MTRIGLLSDTHAYWDEKYLEYFEPCDDCLLYTSDAADE